MNHKVLIVGYGSSGQRYFKIIKKKFPNFQIKVFSKSIKRGSHFLKNFLDINIFKPDTIFLCNPSSERVKYLNLIKKTNNIFFEKPLSNNFKDGKKIWHIVKNKKMSIVGYNLRFLNILDVVRKNLKNYVGNVYSFNCESGSFLPNWRKKNYQYSVSAQKKLGGGALLELSHELDYINWIFGKKYETKAFYRNSKILNLDAEDNVKIIFNFSNKILGSLSLDFLKHKKKRLLTINGTKGILKVDLIKNNLSLLSVNKTRWKKIQFRKNNISSTYADLVSYFFNKTKNKSLIKKTSKVKDGLFILKVIEEIKK